MPLAQKHRPLPAPLGRAGLSLEERPGGHRTTVGRQARHLSLQSREGEVAQAEGGDQQEQEKAEEPAEETKSEEPVEEKKAEEPAEETKSEEPAEEPAEEKKE